MSIEPAARIAQAPELERETQAVLEAKRAEAERERDRIAARQSIAGTDAMIVSQTTGFSEPSDNSFPRAS